MMPRFARVNGINIAYRIKGEGPPLVLVMGYRLNSAAWPASFIEQLALNPDGPNDRSRILLRASVQISVAAATRCATSL
jgi:pimeloyl-ACP methyl ester carboxylesterase